MPNYQESQVEGTKWRRCERIEISNPSAPEPPRISFFERDVLSIDGSVVGVSSNAPSFALSVQYDPDAVIDLYDPATLEPTGQTVTHADLYVMLFSAYMTTAVARDNAPPMSPLNPNPAPQP